MHSINHGPLVFLHMGVGINHGTDFNRLLAGPTISLSIQKAWVQGWQVDIRQAHPKYYSQALQVTHLILGTTWVSWGWGLSGKEQDCEVRGCRFESRWATKFAPAVCLGLGLPDVIPSSGSCTALHKKIQCPAWWRLGWSWAKDIFFLEEKTIE